MCPGTFNQLFWYSLAAHCWYSDVRHLTAASSHPRALPGLHPGSRRHGHPAGHCTDGVHPRGEDEPACARPAQPLRPVRAFCRAGIAGHGTGPGRQTPRHSHLPRPRHRRSGGDDPLRPDTARLPCLRPLPAGHLVHRPLLPPGRQPLCQLLRPRFERRPARRLRRAPGRRSRAVPRPRLLSLRRNRHRRGARLRSLCPGHAHRHGPQGGIRPAYGAGHGRWRGRFRGGFRRRPARRPRNAHRRSERWQCCGLDELPGRA